MKKLLIIAALVTGLALAGVAAAEPGEGASVVNEEYCLSSPLATWCWDVKTVTNETATPSGNVSYVMNGGVDYSVSFPTLGCTSTKSEPIHLHWLQRDGETQSHSERIGQTTSFVCAGGFPYSCTSSFELHETRGDVQFQRFEFTCTND